MSQRPGGSVGRRPLHFFWLADCSGSMANGGKIQALNYAVREALPHLVDVSEQNPHADLLVRCLAFSSRVFWHVATPTPADQLVWRDLEAVGYTNLGLALHELAGQLHVPPMESRAMPPAIVLISDGQPTDDYRDGLTALMGTQWGRRSVRLAIAIGQDADRDVLREFIGDPSFEPLEARNPDQLTRYLRWASTVASRVASEVGPQSGGRRVVTPPPPGDDQLTF